MKLKNFHQFVNEEIETLEAEETVFLIDNVLYLPYEFEFDISWGYETPDSSVGYQGGSYVEDYEIYAINQVYKITDPETISQINTMLADRSELATMGLGDSDLTSAIYDVVGDADQIEVEGEELAEFEKKFIQYWKSNKINEIDLVSNFTKIVDKFIENLDPPEEDEPDYSDWEE